MTQNTHITDDGLPNLMTSDSIAAANKMLPSYMIGGLMRYMNDGTRPGDFLSAVLKNNLMDAFSYADETNAQSVRDWARWLYNYAPSQAFGSVGRFTSWCDRGGLRGHIATQEFPDV